MYQRGNSWYSVIVWKGIRYKKSWGDISKSKAKEKDEKFKSDIRDGNFKTQKQNPRFDTALEEYLKKVKTECEQSTYESYCHSAARLKAFFGRRRLDQIEGNEILMRKYVEKRKGEIREYQLKAGRTEKELSYTNVNGDLRVMRAMFNVLIKAGKATKNPVHLVSMFQEVEKERILTDEEEERLFEAIEKIDKRGDHLKDFVVLALHTGMRLREILYMQESWINLKEGVIIVPRYNQKRKKKDKRVPINSEIRPIIEGLLKGAGENGFLFENPATGKPIHSIKKSWLHAIKEAGLDGKPGVDRLRIHDLRHTAATRLMRNTKNMKLVAQYLGHTDIKTTARYLHPDDVDLAVAAESLVRRVTPKLTPGGQKQSFTKVVSIEKH